MVSNGERPLLLPINFFNRQEFLRIVEGHEIARVGDLTADDARGFLARRQHLENIREIFLVVRPG